MNEEEMNKQQGDSDIHDKKKPVMRSVTRNTQVIAVGNQKGGVAKTTTAVQLAAALGEMGRTCLIFDLDSGSGASKHFGVLENANYHGTLEVLTGQDTLDDVIITDADEDIHLPKGVHLLPARRNLEDVEKELRNKDRYYVAHEVLNEPLRQLRGKYDYVFLDTPPHTLGAMTIASYASADWFILSTFPEQFGMDGIVDAIRDIAGAQGRVNPKLKLLGVVLSAINKNTRMSKTISSYLSRQVMPNINVPLKFDTNITRSVEVAKAQEKRMSLFQFNGTHAVADQYRALAREVEVRIESISKLMDGSSVGQGTSRTLEAIEEVRAEVANG